MGRLHASPVFLARLAQNLESAFYQWGYRITVQPDGNWKGLPPPTLQLLASLQRKAKGYQVEVSRAELILATGFRPRRLRKNLDLLARQGLISYERVKLGKKE